MSAEEDGGGGGGGGVCVCVCMCVRGGLTAHRHRRVAVDRVRDVELFDFGAGLVVVSVPESQWHGRMRNADVMNISERLC